jgi:hypothetical protein
MPFGAYNSNGVRLLCGALADSLEYVRKATGRELSEAEVSDIRKTLVHRLTIAHDSGERDPDALKRAAVSIGSRMAGQRTEPHAPKRNAHTATQLTLPLR